MAAARSLARFGSASAARGRIAPEEFGSEMEHHTPALNGPSQFLQLPRRHPSKRVTYLRSRQTCPGSDPSIPSLLGPNLPPSTKKQVRWAGYPRLDLATRVPAPSAHHAAGSAVRPRVAGGGHVEHGDAGRRSTAPGRSLRRTSPPAAPLVDDKHAQPGEGLKVCGLPQSGATSRETGGRGLSIADRPDG
ncbi:hypothetical protein AAFF_G00092110 [Aldrovandia affinis]|uniref:Uncharacterized protein n=1 Tax=Aldrovandia affinis TaxID=143900 RepID=A0AAD7T2X6_9TELE|nr:hypothetical protein AAFF_G00092110 [Aldrovandia affinis]